MKPRGSRVASGGESSSRREANSKREGIELNNNVLFVQESHVSFEPPNQKVSVFFDECNREIIRLTSGVVVGNTTASSSTTQPSMSSPTTTTSTKTRVIFQATDRSDKAEFLLPIEKRILSIKFNSNRTVLAYHVEKSNIEFINVRQLSKSKQQEPENVVIEQCYVLDEKRYVQASRAKNSKLFGFLWIGSSELVMITDISIEYYHVDASKRRLKHMKSFQSATNWFVYQPCHALGQQSTVGGQVTDLSQPLEANELDHTHHHSSTQSTSSYSILMVSTGSLGNSMQPYMFTRGQVSKLQKFEVDGNWKGGEKLELFERSITIASIYGQVRLLVLQHESLNLNSRGAQILLYTVDEESGQTSLTHTLDLDVNGRFAINILDNLIVAHDQPSRTSFIFDIMIESTEKSDCPRHFVSLINKQTIKPVKSRSANKDIELYSTNWVFFQPNFIIDAKLGLLLTLQLNLNDIRESIPDSLVLLNFLAHRKHSEQIILDECRDIVAKSQQQTLNTSTSQLSGSPLMDVSSAFDILGRLAVSAPEIKRKSADPQEQQRQASSARQQPAAAATSAAAILAAGPLPPQAPLFRSRSGAVYSARLGQEDVSREVLGQLRKLDIKHPAQFHFISSTLLEFIFACRRQDKNVDFCICEQLVNCLLTAGRFFQLVQMIRANILTDSKQLACLLLTNRNLYPPATQLGLDMLQRLNCLTDLVESLSLAPTATSSRANLHSETASRLSLSLNQSIEVVD